MPSMRKREQEHREQPAVTMSATRSIGSCVSGSSASSELRRIHVPLLILEDGVVERRVRRVAVEYRVRGREVREAHVPGEEALAPG